MDPQARVEHGTTTKTPPAASVRPALLTHDGFDPQTERGVEAALSVANGAFGVRASLEEGNPASHPLLVVAGVFVPTPLAAAQTLLAVGDPASIGILIDGRPLSMSLAETLAHRRTLNFADGEMLRSWSFRDADGRIWLLESLRAASAADPGACLHRLRLAPDADAGAIVTLRFPSDPTRQGGAAGETRIVTAEDASPLPAIEIERRLRGRWSVRGDAAEALVTATSPLVMESVARIGAAPAPAAPFDAQLVEHRRVWAARWADADVVVESDDALQDAAGFATYHLLAAAPVDDGRSSIGARGLSGEAYHGHVFWDTEIFMLPALTFAHPDAARACLRYRHRTLDAARARARALGYAGALFAWESTDTGEDRTPASAILPDGSTIRILTGEQEHLIAAVVPYAVMRFWHATADDAFMLSAGAEIVLECARFWNSRVTFADHEHAIRKVIGPDEYHVGVDNDAFTNAMAAWTLRTAAALPGQLAAVDAAAARDLLARLAVRPAECDDWAATAVRIGRSSFRGPEVVEQFDGFFVLDSVDVASFRRAGVPIDIAVGFDAVQRLRVLKQADVLMAAALLPDLWSEAALRANFDYYEPITAHTSSLSPPMHALVAAWLRDASRCRAYLDETARIDLAGFRGAAGGVHLGAQGGLWQALVFGLAGFKFDADGIAFDPFLPDGVRALACTLRWRGRRVRVRVRAEGALDVDVEGAAVTVRVNGVRRTVAGHATFAFDPSVTYWSAATGGEHVA